MAIDRASQRKIPRIAAQDDRVLVDLPRNHPVRENTFATMNDMGVKLLRVNVWWKAWKHEGYRARLDSTVQQAKDNKMAVEMTITGGVAKWTGGKGVNPGHRAYGRFARQVAERFSPQGVRRYSIWNEPNHTGFFLGGPHAKRYHSLMKRGQRLATQLESTVDPARKQRLETAARRNRATAKRLHTRHVRTESAVQYGKLARAGYNAVNQANRANRVGVGELAPHSVHRFLDDMTSVKPVTADEFALHPYQFSVKPEKRDGAPGSGGMGRLGQVQAKLGRLAAQGRLKQADGDKLELHLTEFGYQKQGGSTHYGQVSDAKRAAWSPRAIAQAERAGAKQILFYHLADPGPDIDWNTTIFTADGKHTPVSQAIEGWVDSRKARRRN